MKKRGKKGSKQKEIRMEWFLIIYYKRTKNKEKEFILQVLDFSLCIHLW